MITLLTSLDEPSRFLLLFVAGLASYWIAHRLIGAVVTLVRGHRPVERDALDVDVLDDSLVLLAVRDFLHDTYGLLGEQGQTLDRVANGIDRLVAIEEDYLREEAEALRPRSRVDVPPYGTGTAIHEMIERMNGEPAGAWRDAPRPVDLTKHADDDRNEGAR